MEAIKKKLRKGILAISIVFLSGCSLLNNNEKKLNYSIDNLINCTIAYTKQQFNECFQKFSDSFKEIDYTSIENFRLRQRVIEMNQLFDFVEDNPVDTYTIQQRNSFLWPSINQIINKIDTDISNEKREFIANKARYYRVKNIMFQQFNNAFITSIKTPYGNYNNRVQITNFSGYNIQQVTVSLFVNDDGRWYIKRHDIDTNNWQRNEIKEFTFISNGNVQEIRPFFSQLVII